METDTLYYVLRPGATREEQWSWADIEGLCRSGELTGDSRVFLVDEDRWARISETRLAELVNSGSAAEEPVDEEHLRLQSEYEAAVERISTETDTLEAMLDAGALAAQLGRLDDAREHLQTVLHAFPYHARAAQEVKRRFSRSDQKTFRYLDRPSPAWEDLGAVVAMPFARSPLYVLVPTLIFAGLSWVPFGAWVTTVIAFLWIFQVMEYTARGPSRPPDWDRSFKDPFRKLLRPLGLMALVLAQWGVLVVAIAKGLMALEKVHSVSIWGYLAGSPIFVVIASIGAVLYLPAAFVSIGGFSGSILKTLNPKRLVKTIIRMEHEYAYSVALLMALAVPSGIIYLLIAGVPIASNIVGAFLVAYAAPVAGLILGRLLGRTGHLIS